MSPRLLLHLLAALLTTLLIAGSPAAAEPVQRSDVSYVAEDALVLPPRQVDHGSRRPRHTASLEEFFEIDDDAEQYFKLLPNVVRPLSGFTLVVEPSPSPYSNAPPSHRACAAYPTGPPSA